MRPATALAPDGPQNVVDALTVASTAGARGVVAVCAGTIHGAEDVAKEHPWRLDAFTSGDAGPIGYVENAQLRLVRDWARSAETGASHLDAITKAVTWPRVEIVMSHAGAGAAVVDALLVHGVDGLVVAGTGNATLHIDLEEALLRARTSGVRVVRATRCAQGRVIGRPDDPIPDAGGLSAVKARIALILALLAQ